MANHANIQPRLRTQKRNDRAHRNCIGLFGSIGFYSELNAFVQVMTFLTEILPIDVSLLHEKRETVPYTEGIDRNMYWARN